VTEKIKNRHITASYDTRPGNEMGLFYNAPGSKTELNDQLSIIESCFLRLRHLCAFAENICSATLQGV